MSERTAYADGEFCWVELISPDVEAAARFYGDLLGWKRERYEPDPEGYWYFRHMGKLVAGQEGIRSKGLAPAWLGYVKVDDMGTTAGKVGEAGGTVLEGPLEAPGGAGSLAVCRDAEGAAFALWQPGELNGAELVNEPGSWTWSSLMSRDVDRAKDFYGQVFDWTATQPEGAPDHIWNWHVAGQRWPEGLGSLTRMGSDMPPDAPPQWQPYFVVESMDRAVGKTKAAGGSLIFGPVDNRVGDRIALVIDPQETNVWWLEPHFPEPR